jgi:hypothetical protein
VRASERELSISIWERTTNISTFRSVEFRTKPFTRPSASDVASRKTASGTCEASQEVQHQAGHNEFVDDCDRLPVSDCANGDQFDRLHVSDLLV